MKQLERLDEDNVVRLNCCPGGFEIAEKELGGDLGQMVLWQQEMIRLGATGYILRCEDSIRGFVQYMPKEVAPMPICADRAAVLLCFHYNPPPEHPQSEHLRWERRLVEAAAADARKQQYSGMAALGWYHPSHFPVDFLEELGFEVVEANSEAALMWLPLDAGADAPQIAPQTFYPRDLSSEGRVAVDLGYSHRCPYEIHHHNRIAALCDSYCPERVSYRQVVTDSREQVLANRAPSWNWHWLYVNGTEFPASKLDTFTLTRLLDNQTDLHSPA